MESAESLLNSMFFDDRRDHLAKVGRYKYNKKLALARRLTGQVIAEDVINPETGEVLAEAGQKIDRETAWKSRMPVSMWWMFWSTTTAGTNRFGLSGMALWIFHKQDIPFDISDLDIHELVYKEVLDEILESDMTDEEKHKAMKKRMDELLPKHILHADLFATVSYFLGLDYDIGSIDDIDHRQTVV